MLGVNGSTQGTHKCNSKFQDQLYRELAAKSLHPLVDRNYLGFKCCCFSFNEATETTTSDSKEELLYCIIKQRCSSDVVSRTIAIGCRWNIFSRAMAIDCG
ncbi:hypothetical protein CCR75_006233 [Bremia lactucae]|uniref:Uncharacterized protein n=1 Tax=Bremia lactucae TaxID=4779 RepID=A0A976ILX8_BRELC|nr:hypothetical protein CCR75_006233 [Bremia lactucae]